MSNLLTPWLFLFFLCLYSANSVANKDYPSLYLMVEEAGAEEEIYGIGTAVTMADPLTHLGMAVTTSLSGARVITEAGNFEDYGSWEGSVQLGYFSDLSLYAEVGIDLSELLFHEYRYDRDGRSFQECCRNSDYRCCDDVRQDDIDAYAGIGMGFSLGAFDLRATYRLREIDSLDWEARSKVFTGVQVSIRF